MSLNGVFKASISFLLSFILSDCRSVSVLTFFSSLDSGVGIGVSYRTNLTGDYILEMSFSS
jgi:hypothetical protein